MLNHVHVGVLAVGYTVQGDLEVAGEVEAEEAEVVFQEGDGFLAQLAGDQVSGPLSAPGPVLASCRVGGGVPNRANGEQQVFIQGLPEGSQDRSDLLQVELASLCVVAVVAVARIHEATLKSEIVPGHLGSYVVRSLGVRAE